ncbi:MAG: 3-dehydroquinate dehydratase/shikimate dehydrogenase [Planctomycetota bacterium]|jgi:3-dehydroquinate dehydratase/shikimate dehydrogenase
MAIVVSHKGTNFELLAAQALRQAALADVIELRLDTIGNPGVEALRAFIESAGKPVIVACNRADAYGEFTGTDEELLALLHTAAEAGAGFVDVPWYLSLELGEVKGKCHRIVSRHDITAVPTDLPSFLEEVREVLYEGDLIKLVGHAESTEEALRMLAFVGETGGGLIGFCAGEQGSFTRVLAPIFGSPFTYAAPAVLDGDTASEPTAPGQMRVNDLLALMPPGGLTQETAIFGIVGRPVGHSYSPRVHGMTLKAARLDAVYVSFEPDSFEDFLKQATLENFRGFSITAPFKEEAFRAARSTTSGAREAKAVNTLIRDGQHWKGANTDASAVEETLGVGFRHHASRLDQPLMLSATQTLILGTGGAARAVATAVRSLGGQFLIAGRDPAKAELLAIEMGGAFLAWEQIPTSNYDALVNATPLGSLAAPGISAIPADWIKANSLVLDAVYRPIRTPLLVEAHKRGCTAIPGGEWFVRQAAEQFQLFTRTEPDSELLRAAFETALKEDS